MVSGLTEQDAVDAIERLPGGLGTATVALLQSERRRARALAIEGVAPTLENVADGSYPYVKTMYLVVTQDAPASVMKFVQFAGSGAGRRVLAEMGHLPPTTR
jgi:phosphate transport system substrate-binding protein